MQTLPATTDTNHDAPAVQWHHPQSWASGMQLADTLAQSALVPTALRGKPADVLVILMTGAELGLSPLLALRSIHVVEGKPTLSADLMGALCQRSPACEWLRLVHSDEDRAEWATLRRGHGEPATMAFTRQGAQRAGLLGRANWQKYPAAMLRARALTALCRAVYPDVCAGIYDPDEIVTDTAPRRESVRLERVSLPTPPEADVDAPPSTPDTRPRDGSHSPPARQGAERGTDAPPQPPDPVAVAGQEATDALVELGLEHDEAISRLRRATAAARDTRGGRGRPIAEDVWSAYRVLRAEIAGESADAREAAAATESDDDPWSDPDTAPDAQALREASLAALLRVPGVGQQSAQAFVELGIRDWQTLRTYLVNGGRVPRFGDASAETAIAWLDSQLAEQARMRFNQGEGAE